MSVASYCEIWGKTDAPCDRPTCAICVAAHAIRKSKRLCVAESSVSLQVMDKDNAGFFECSITSGTNITVIDPLQNYEFISGDTKVTFKSRNPNHAQAYALEQLAASLRSAK